MDDLDGMVEDGWTQADGLAAETNILMRIDFKIPFCSSADLVCK